MGVGCAYNVAISNLICEKIYMESSSLRYNYYTRVDSVLHFLPSDVSKDKW